MKNKIIFGIIIFIIIVGAIIIPTIGLRADLAYSENVRINVYISKSFEESDIKQIAKEVFGDGKIIVQKVEYFDDMAAITIEKKNAENMEEKLTELNNKINEKYEVENKVEEAIEVFYQPKIKLSSIIMPYIIPIAISAAIILVYALIRYRKLGVLKTLLKYIACILVPEALYLSILAIIRFPINRLVVPVGLLIYVLAVTILTVVQENKYNKYIEEQK